jgi:hypothetical protein
VHSVSEDDAEAANIAEVSPFLNELKSTVNASINNALDKKYDTFKNF